MPKVIDPRLKAEARRLRASEHLGLEVIAARTGISKATLSVLLRDLPLSAEASRAKSQLGALRTTTARWGAARVRAVAEARLATDVTAWTERTWHFRPHASGTKLTFIGLAGIHRLIGPDTPDRAAMVWHERLVEADMLVVSARVLEGDDVPRYVLATSVCDIPAERSLDDVTPVGWADLTAWVAAALADAILHRAGATASARVARDAMAAQLPVLGVSSLVHRRRADRVAGRVPSSAWWDIHRGTLGPAARPWQVPDQGVADPAVAA